MLLKIAKENQFFQNLFISISSLIQPPIKHNFGKLDILKYAFWYVASEEVEGGYFEFGTYEGTSMLAAIKVYKRTISKESQRLLSSVIKRRFYGFDSFEGGFQYHDNSEEHPTFKVGGFVSSYEKCKKRLSGYPEIKLIKGYFEDTIANELPSQIPTDEKCAIVFIDCDLKTPAEIALNFLKPRLQKGSVIILDDVFTYKGNPTLGVQGAWGEFLQNNPAIKVREFFDWGCSGKSYIIYDI